MDIIVCRTFDETTEEALKLLKERLPSGGKHVFIVPDSFTLNLERYIMESLSLSATFNIEVTTFKRLQSRFETKEKTSLGKTGLIMLLGKLADNEFFGASAAKKGFAEKMYETIAQLKSSAVKPENLEISPKSELLNRKIRGIKKLYATYRDEMKEKNFTDAGDKYEELIDAVYSGGWFKDKNVYLLQFNNYTPQMLKIVKALAENSLSLTVGAVGGKNYIYTENFAGRLEAACKGVMPVNIYRPESTFSGFKKALAEGVYGRRDNAAYRIKNRELTVYEASGPQEEIEAVASEIRYYAFKGERYKDFAVALPDEKYLPVVADVFADFGIPCYIEEKLALASHPLAKFILSALSAVASNFKKEKVIDFISNYFFGEYDKGCFINTVRANGINYTLFKKSFSGLCGEEKELAEAEKIRLRLIYLLGDLSAKEQICASDIEALMEKADTEKRMAAYAEKCGEYFVLTGNGRYGREKEFSERAEERISSILAEASLITPYQTCEEMFDMLDNGFRSESVSLVPLYSDCVFVGNTDQCKYLKPGRLFIPGVNDRVFPAVKNDCGVITDGELSELMRLNLLIEPQIKTVNMREKLNAYMLLLKPEKSLYLSYRADKAPSRIISEVLGCVADCSGAPFEISRKEEADSPEKFAAALGAPEAAYPEISHVKTYGECIGYWKYAVNLIDSGTEKRVFPAKADTDGLYFGKNVTSVSEIEKYCDCPYAHFMRYGLKLQPVKDAEIKALDKGNFVHGVLEKFFTGLKNNFNLTSGELKSAVEKAVAEEKSKPEYLRFLNSEKSAKTLAKLSAECVNIAAVAYEQLASGDFRVEACEKQFYYDFGLKIKDKPLEFTGKIDRIDSCGELVRVIDYKTGSREFDYGKIAAGLNLQLPLYLMSASEGRRPAGAYYLRCHDKITDAETGVRVRDRRLDGITNSAPDVIKATDRALYADMCGRSSVARLKLNKNSTESGLDFDSRSSLVVSDEEFAGLFRFVRKKVKESFEGITGGDISKRPYEGSCDYCDYAGLCTFPEQGGEFRKTKKTDITEIIGEKEAGDE